MHSWRGDCELTHCLHAESAISSSSTTVPRVLPEFGQDLKVVPMIKRATITVLPCDFLSLAFSTLGEVDVIHASTASSFLSAFLQFPKKCHIAVLLDFRPNNNTVTLEENSDADQLIESPSLVRFEKLQGRLAFTRSPLLHASPVECAQSRHLIATFRTLLRICECASHIFSIFIAGVS
jgi:hypothetical protein